VATLTSIRNRQPVILWAFLFIFLLSLSIGGLVGGANVIDQIFGSNLMGNAVGVVNSNRIPIDELSQEIARQTQQARAQYGDLSDRLVEQAETEAWESIIVRRLLSEEMEDRRLECTGEEIYYVLQNFPPVFLQQNEAFQKEGQFAPELYYQALNNPVGNEWLSIENYLASVLPGEKMNLLIQAMNFSSEEEVKSAWHDRNTRATIDYLYVPTSVINTADIVISDDDVSRYYRQNRPAYERPETRILEYVAWEKLPTAADTASIIDQAEGIIRRANEGEDFAQLALDYSEDPGSGPNGGDLGWFGKGQMVKSFDEAAFGVEPGEIVGPVMSQFGYHIIKVHERRGAADSLELHASHILLRVELSSSSLNALRNEASLFSFDAADSSFEVVLNSRNLTAKLSPPLTRDAKYLPPPVGMLRSAVRFAFEAETGAISDVMENDRSFVVSRLTEIRPEGPQPLEEVRAGIERELREESRKEQVTLLMANIQAQLTAGTAWSDIAESFPEVAYGDSIAANINGSFSGIGRSPVLFGAVKGLEVGQVSGVISLERGQAIIQLISLDEPDWADYQDSREIEHRALLNRRMNASWSRWIGDLKEQAEIIDNRYVFY